MASIASNSGELCLRIIRQPSDHSAGSSVTDICAVMVLHPCSETYVSLQDRSIIGGMSSTPRDRQTRRTRRALVDAADALFAEGRVPTVAAVAERADVARATAYRYFPSQEALLLETTFLGDSDAMRAIPELADTV